MVGMGQKDSYVGCVASELSERPKLKGVHLVTKLSQNVVS